MKFEHSKLQQLKTQLERSHTWLQQLQEEIEQPKSSQSDPRIDPSIPVKPSKKILFYREFGGLTGGHLKVWDYFNHVLHSQEYLPYIYFSPNSHWDDSNPWKQIDQEKLLSSPLKNPALIFMEGMDWEFLDPSFRERSPIPIINLIQHIRHADPDNPRYTFLKYKAIRICVSPEVETYLRESRQVNGPLYAIPCGIDPALLPQPIDYLDKDYDILIAALKEPQLGQALQHQLNPLGKRIAILTTQLSRQEYLQWINRAKMTVFLPNQKEGEGFYLPALEGMALETLVICPDCIGNRSFCLPNYNCFRPKYTMESIVNEVKQALNQTPSQIQNLLKNAKRTVKEYNLIQEQQLFLNILNNIKKIW